MPSMAVRFEIDLDDVHVLFDGLAALGLGAALIQASLHVPEEIVVRRITVLARVHTKVDS
jgi:hypothetical protein